jgi:aconitate hydratase
MGVLPLQFLPGENANTIGITGNEIINIEGLDDNITPGVEIKVNMYREDQTLVTFSVQVRLNTQIEVDYYRNGGVLNTVLKNML